MSNQNDVPTKDQTSDRYMLASLCLITLSLVLTITGLNDSFLFGLLDVVLTLGSLICAVISVFPSIINRGE